MKAELEPISSGNDESFYSRRFEAPAFDHPFHFHPEIEVVSIVRSRGNLIVGDSIGSFMEGDLFLIGSNVPHIFSHSEPPEDGAISEVLHFREGGSGGHGLMAGAEWASFSELLERAQLGLQFDRKTADQAQTLLKTIRVAECLLGASSATSLASQGYSNDRRMAGSDRIERVCQYMVENYRESISHEDVAKRFHMAPASFSRLFKKATRKTFQDFLNELRLGHACRELRESDSTITEVAFSSGFRNLSNFNRLFKRRFERTPREWRNQYKHLSES